MPAENDEPFEPDARPDSGSATAEGIDPVGASQDSGPAALGRLERQWEELVELFSYFLATRVDAVKQSLWRVTAALVVLILGVAIAAALLVTCVVLALLGLADVVAVALGDRLWAGNLIVGLGILMIGGGALWLGLAAFERRFRKRTLDHYARRREQQRARWGRDVSDWAAERHQR